MLSVAWMQQCNYDILLFLSLFSLFVGLSLPFVVRIASGHVVALIFPVRYSFADAAADIISTNDCTLYVKQKALARLDSSFSRPARCGM